MNSAIPGDEKTSGPISGFSGLNGLENFMVDNLNFKNIND